MLVAWDDDVALTPAAVRFLESLPLTRLMMGYASGSPPMLPDAILFSMDASMTAVRSLCERLPPRKGPCASSPMDAWSELFSTLTQSNLSLMVTDVEDKAWTLYWMKQEDSNALTATDVKDRVRALLAAAQRLLSF